MTKRAILVGLAGTLLIGAGGRYTAVHGVGMGIAGHLPILVFGLLVLFSLVLNPLMARILPGGKFTTGETALVVAMFLAACSIPSAGLMGYFPRTLLHPVVNNRSQPGWQRLGLLEMTPPALLVNDGKYSEEVVLNYVTGMGKPGHPIPLSAVPWHAWWKPLAIWGAIIGFVLMGVVSLSVLLHRQWASRERLRYPLAELATSLLKQGEDGRVAIFRSRRFWAGLLVALVIRLLYNYHAWIPSLVYVPLDYDFSAIRVRLPAFMATPGAQFLAVANIYPTCVGVTCLLASEIGFSLSVSNLLTVLVLYAMAVHGVDTSGNSMAGGVTSWPSFGGFLAMAVMILYSGRRHYWNTLREAVSFRPHEETEPADVNACRVFIVCMAGAATILTLAGLNWPVAMLAVFLVMLSFMGCARLVAECGTFYFVPAWMLPGVLTGLFGISALGPQAIIILGLFFYILNFDTFCSLMPYAVNGMKIVSDASLKVGRVGILIGASLLVAIAIAIPATLWSDYNYGADMRRGGDTRDVYDAAARTADRLALSGKLDEAVHAGAWDQLKRMRPSSRFVLSAGLGFALVAGCSFMRLRYTWWPLHPVVFIGFGSWTIGKFGFSFFLGWLIRALVTRFGGLPSYLRIRPAIIGIVIGDLTGGFVLLIAGWLYYAITGARGVGAMLW